MTKDELLKALRKCIKESKIDEECAHERADGLLLQYINDADVSKAFAAIDKWYA